MKHLFSAASGRPACWLYQLLTMFALLLAVPVARAQLFGSATTYNSGAGGTPVGVAVGDLNGDGLRDVVTANNALNSVGVLLGTGTGSLGTVATYSTGPGSAPQWVALGDLNADGRLDVVTANSGSNAVGVLLGAGTGAFSTVTTYGTGAGSTPLGVALADVNGDGYLDVLTANYGSNAVGVLLGSGSGSLGTVTTYGTGAGSAPIGLAVADVNQDGKPDVATANSGANNAGVLLGTGSGTFSPVTTYGTGSGSAPGGVALADLNADGYPDLVTANSATNNAGVLLNGGSGTFGVVATYGTGSGSAPAAVAVADLNADGRPDLVTANSGTSTAGVLLGTGAGAFGPVTTYGTGSGSTPFDVRLADLNGDNLPDLISNNNGSSTVGVLLNQNATATISSFTPATSRAGGTVTVTGTGLTGATGVTVNGTAGTLAGTPTGTTLSFVVGAGSSTGLIRVTTSGSGTATSSTNLTIVPTPALSSATPTAGATGTVLSATGTDLQNPTAVTFTGVGGTFAAAAGYSANVTGTTLSNVVVPGGLQPGPATLTVTTAGGTSNALSFQVTLPPTITSFAPSSGVAGTVVTLTGTRLSDVTGLTVNGVAAAFTLSSATSLSFTVPVGAGATQQVVLTSPGGTSVPSTAFTAFVGVTSTNPAGNSRNAPLAGSALALTFSEPVTAASAANLKVFSAQVGGKKAGTVAVSRSTARYTSTLPAPRTDFKPGEVVSVTAPAAIVGAGGLPLSKRVYQFTAGVNVSGTGYFTAGPDAAVSDNTVSNAVGDFDGDGDLDLVSAGSYSNLLSVRFNNGSGVYSGTTDFNLGFVTAVTVGDIDNDGDLDIVAGQGPLAGSTAVPLFNNGSGTFTVGSAVSLGASNCYGVTLADFDGDGDLDLAGTVYYANQLAIRFNNGSGVFSGSQQLNIGPNPWQVLSGDFDNDGDIDLIACNTPGNSGSSYCARVALNNGSGTFTTGATVGNTDAHGLGVGDVDNDGDLDVVVMPYTNTPNIDTYLNNGSGTFTYFSRATQPGSYPRELALADLDGDGDLDVAVPGSGALTIRLNNGRGVFGGGQVRTETGSGRGIATGDVDGDGDIDLLCGNGGSPGAIYVRLNGPATYPAITSFTPSSGAQGTTVTITGTNLAGATSVSFNGTTTTAIVNNTATSLTVNVPTGATTGYISVTTAANGTGAPSTDPFTIVPPPTISSFTPSSGPQGSFVTITGTNLTGTSVVRFNGTPSTVINANTATSLSVQVPAGATTGPVSLTNPGGTATSTASFTVTATPVLTSIVPGSGPVGATVVLNGSNLAGTRVITFGGNVDVTTGFAVNAAGTRITGIVVPSGAVTGNVTVGFSNGLPFTVTPLLSITQVTPAPLSVTAAPAAPVQVTFDQSLQASSAGALKVHSSQRGGLRTLAGSPATVAGNTLSFAPGTPFVAGEVVQSTVTLAAVGTNDAQLSKPRVVQHSVGVSTAGTGNFPNGSEVGVGFQPKGIATGDVDGDGDLDFVVANSGTGANSVTVRLNGGDASGSNNGAFSNGATLTLPQRPFSVVLGDLDGDGDLDLVTNNYNSTASIRFNDGLGTFTGTQEVTMSFNSNSDRVIGGITLGDIDGDGDLDMVSAAIGTSNALGVRFNDGAGNFAASQLVLSGPSNLSEVALGDIDGDGDLDVVAPAYYSNSSVSAPVYLMLNDGAGAFNSYTSMTPTGVTATGIALGDVDNDGDLDIVIGNSSTSSHNGAPYAVTVFRNNGTGAFGFQGVATGRYPAQVALGDIDGDGDLDLLTTGTDVNTVSVRLNNGTNTGAFSAGPEIPVGQFPNGIVLADVDGDGDLDFLVTNKNANTVSVRRNSGLLPPSITSFTPTSGASGTAVTITGQNLTGATSVAFNGTVTTAMSNNTATSLTVPVPAGASTGLITLTTPGGTATSSTVFTVPGTGGDYLLNNNTPLTVCSGTLYDSGGPNGNYRSSESYTKVLTPGTTGAKLRLTFTSFVTEWTRDYLYVYDGNSTLAPLLGAFSSSTLPDAVTATNAAGQLTVRFTSDNAREYAGFAALLSCVLPAPTITSLSPVSGPVGTSVSVTGTELSGTFRLTLNGVDVPGFTVVGNSSITFTVPSGASTGLVSVVTPGGSASSPAPFTVTSGAAQLAVTQGGNSYANNSTYDFGSQVLNTTSAPVAFQLTNAGTAALTISSLAATGDYAISGTMPTTVPAGGSAAVSLTFTPTTLGVRPGALTISSSLGTYTVNLTGTGRAPLPVLASISPGSGPVGSPVVLNGSNLAGTTTVTFAGGATVTSGFSVNAAGTQITGIVVPASAATGNVTVTNPNGTSNGVAFNVCRPVALARNLTLTLGLDGTATLTATALDNGSSSACGPLTLRVQRLGTVSRSVREGNTLNLTAPGGTTFAGITFASYGTPNGSVAPFTLGSCHAATSQARAEAAFVGRSSGSLLASDTNPDGTPNFGDPCPGTAKRLAVAAAYPVGVPAASLTFACDEVGPQPVLLLVTDAGGTTSSVLATVTVTTDLTRTSTTWTGAVSHDWKDCRNWSYGLLPSPSCSAFIPPGLTRYPNLPANAYPVRDLTLASGSQLTTALGAILQVAGSWTDNGASTSIGGGVVFTGGASQSIGGTAGTAFRDLTVRKSGGSLTLGRDLTIDNSLTLDSGTLSTDSYKVMLAPTASLSETDASYVTGAVQTTRPVSTPGTAELFGGLGLTLTPAAGSSALPGSTQVTRVTGTALNGAGSRPSIMRYFDIQPTINAGLDVELAFSYFNHERNGVSATNAHLFKSSTGTGGPWRSQGGTVNGNTVTRSGVSDFSVWTLADAAGPLPVELAHFTAQAAGPATVRLAWTTASEANSLRFEVERSRDGARFARLGNVAAAGHSSSARAYAYLDADAPAGVVYYRLRQVDLDGTVSYSPVRAVTLAGPAAAGIYPNPAHTRATVVGVAAGTRVVLLDAVGRVLTQADADATGTAQLAWPAGLAEGVYVVRAGAQALRLVVK